MVKKKLKWNDVEDIAFRLIDQNPTVNPLRLRFTDLLKQITALPDFSDDPKKSNESVLEAIQMCWYEERAEMEDELGPMEDETDDETLDEDDYRDDKLVEDEKEADLEDDDDEEEDEDEFGDGFQEEGEGEEREH